MSETTELAVLPPKESALQVYSTPKGLEPYLAKIRAEIDSFNPDVKSKKGRDAIASIAFKVAKAKTALDNVGKELVAELKDVPKKIDAERKWMRDTLDSWKDEVRAPLTAWEKAEEARIEKHRGAIEWFVLSGQIRVDDPGMSGAKFSAVISEVDQTIVDEAFEEFEAEAHRAKAKALDALTMALAAREKLEAEQAELAELRIKQAEQEQKDREAQIAKEAEDRTKREAEAKARAEREAVTRREAEAKAAAERRELDLKLAAEKAEREKAEAIQREHQAKADAERKASEAVEAEKRRVAEQAAIEAAEAKRRARDVAHKTAINRAALDAFVKGGLTEECAKQAVTLIAKKAIPAVSITY